LKREHRSFSINLSHDRERAYQILDKHDLKGYSRILAIRLFDSLRSAKRRLKGKKLYFYVMVTISELDYKILGDGVIDGLVDLVIPHFKSMHGRWKRSIK
jgi:hypothetical protein